MMAYLANTLIFMIVGVAITETAFQNMVAMDTLYIFIDYVGVTVIRYLAFIDEIKLILNSCLF